MLVSKSASILTQLELQSVKRAKLQISIDALHLVYQSQQPLTFQYGLMKSRSKSISVAHDDLKN